MKHMKQRIALFLVMIMVITQSVPMFAQVKPLIIRQQKAIHLENGKDAEVTLEVQNATKEVQQAYMITALYNTATNEMVSYNYIAQKLESEETKEWGACIPIPEEGQYKLKAFAWDNMTNPTLLSNVLEIKEEQVIPETYEEILEETSAYLSKQKPEVLQAIGAEWSVFGLARSEYPVKDTYYVDYFSRVLTAIDKEVNSSKPFSHKVTDVQRIAIALTAMGKDVSDINGTDLFAYTWNKEKSFSNLKPPMNELGGMQGLNELIFGLITIDLLDSKVPEGATITREEIIAEILTYHKTDGGFSLNKGTQGSDVDVTAMAIQALAPYYDTHKEVKGAIDGSLTWLSSKQTPSGGFASEFVGESETSESTAQVLVALSSLGVDATKDARFIKGENNPLTNLLSYYAGNGQFKHEADGKANMMGTEQCHYALVAYDRLVKEKPSIYDMSDVTIEGESIQVTVDIDRSSIATDEVLEQMGYNSILAEPMVVTVQEGDSVADVLKAAIEQNSVEIVIESGAWGNYVAGVDGIYSGVTEEFNELCQKLGLEEVPDIFATAGWMFDLNGQMPSSGIDTQLVKQGDVVGLRMSIYSGPDATGNWVNYDWEFINAYEALKELLTSVDESKYTGESLENLKAAVAQAIRILEAIDAEAQGKWLHYIGTKQDKLYGPGSPTEMLKGAYVELEKAIKNVPVIGKVSLAVEKRTIGKGDTIPSREVPIYSGDTVWDVTKRTMDIEGITYEANGTIEAKNIYLASVDGDGEFDFGSGSGWKYEVNGDFSNKGISEYELKGGEVIRFRYCVTVGSSELNKPLVDLLRQYVEKAREYREVEYTQESYAVLEQAIQEADKMINNPANNSQDTKVELEVSKVIGKIIEAINGLEKRDDIITPPSEILPDFENNIGLNKDFLEMQVGGEYQIIARRLGEITNNFVDNDITHPNYRYEVVRGDSVSVNDKGFVTADKIGTSIIAVTYDEITANGKVYGAISPINTGLFVVDVTEGTETGIEIKMQNKENHVITETRSYDTFYFTGDSFEYSFGVEATNSETVKVFVNGQKVEPQNGIYTASLGNSGNIIEIVATNAKGTKKFAQVVDARKVEITVQNLTDPDRDNEIRVDDKVRIKFHGITQPVYKLATIYNPSFHDPNWDELGKTAGTKVVYTNETTGEEMYGKITQYDLAKNNAIEFVAKEEGVYNLTAGHVDEGWWGEPLGAEKEMTGPGNDNTWAKHHHSKFSQLPDISIPVSEKIIIPIEKIEITNAPGQVEENPNSSRIVENDRPYKLETKLYPDKATVQPVIWTSDNEKVLKVDGEGKLIPKSTGIATITVQVEGTDIKDECIINVIPELPATPEERESLKAKIAEAREKIKDVNLYTKDSWTVFKQALDEAEKTYRDGTALLEKVDKARQNLHKSMRNLIFDPAVGVTTSQSITVGSKVTISLPNLNLPQNYEEMGMSSRKMHTVYESNIEGLESITSENGYITNNKIDLKEIRTITFTVPQSTTPGVYTLMNGRVETSSMNPPAPWNPRPQYYSQTFFKGDMPEIKIYVEAGTGSVYAYYTDRSFVHRLLGSTLTQPRWYKMK